MATTWEKLVGDTSRFALKIAFLHDPDRGAGATPEESASWGSFQIWVQGRNLCASQFDEAVSDSVHWYLLPLMEWWAENWDPAFHEERPPNAVKADSALASLDESREAPMGLPDDQAALWEQEWHDWWARHSIEAARSGGLFPPVCFRRWREQVEVSWDGSRPAASPPGFRFFESSGCARLPAAKVAEPLHSVLSEAAEALLARCPGSVRVKQLRERLGRLKAASEERLAWLCGLGNTLSAMQQALGRIMREAKNNLPEKALQVVFRQMGESALVAKPFPAALMFGAASPNLAEEDRLKLLMGMADAIAEAGRTTGRIDELVEEVPVEGERHTWHQGYALAEALLEAGAVRADHHGRIDADATFEHLGVCIAETTLMDRSVRAVAIAGEEFRPTVLLNRTHPTNQFPTGRRFSLAHELCHLLYDRAFAREVALPSGPWAPVDVEKRANAFAAMLLMPAARVREVVSRSPADPASREFVVEVARHFHASFSAAANHLCNLGVLSEDERDTLLDDSSANAEPSDL